MRSKPLAMLLAAGALALLAACGPPTARDVRTPMQAIKVAQATLRGAGVSEEVIDAHRRGEIWVVVTRRPATRSRVGHIVTIDPKAGKVAVDKYSTVELGFGR